MGLPRAMDRWLMPYLRRPRYDDVKVTAVMIAICDHYEPLHKTDEEGALQRVRRWRDDYPRSIEGHVDGAGRGPRHTFFFPIEQYDEEVLGTVSEICARTGAEVEVHLHHEDDDGETLEETLTKGKCQLGDHGLLSRSDDGDLRYGFIHGNWAIGNCHPEGSKCGVDDELEILKRTGCYADFTMPSAPDVTQLGRVNSIYYANVEAMGRRVEEGPSVGAADRLEDGLLMVQGPLGFQWGRRKWGLIPRVENGDLTGVHPPSELRLQLWMDLAPRVVGRPDWAFVKLHTHGAIPKTTAMFLDGVMGQFHARLADVFGGLDGTSHYYVTAREMANLVHAAEDGCVGKPSDYLEHRFSAPPVLAL